MYLISWNPGKHQIEASFGGYITNGEAKVFLEEMTEYLRMHSDGEFSILIDYATVRRMDDEVLTSFESARDAGQFAGAEKVTFVARNDRGAEDSNDDRLQQGLEGQEEYVAYRLAG